MAQSEARRPQGAVVTISDACVRGKREDTSGVALRELLASIADLREPRIIPDDRPMIEATLRELADNGVDLLLTTGGTGLGPRDVTPEATLAVIDRLVPGFAEQMRAEGMKKTPRAIMSRAVAGIRGTSIILNLPGSPKGAVDSRSEEHTSELQS